MGGWRGRTLEASTGPTPTSNARSIRLSCRAPPTGTYACRCRSGRARSRSRRTPPTSGRRSRRCSSASSSSSRSSSPSSPSFGASPRSARLRLERACASWACPSARTGPAGSSRYASLRSCRFSGRRGGRVSVQTHGLDRHLRVSLRVDRAARRLLLRARPALHVERRRRGRVRVGVRADVDPGRRRGRVRAHGIERVDVLVRDDARRVHLPVGMDRLHPRNAKEGARWDTIGDNLLDGGEYAGKTLGNFSGSLIMRIVAANGAAYAVIAWFLNGTENVANVFVVFRRSTSAPSSAEDSENLDASADDEAALPGGVEPDPAVGEPAAIRARNLVVTFGGVAAVNGLRFVARRGRVTSLLGHNGAGKTTTISVLTGLLRGDGGRGRAFVDGADVETEMERARARAWACVRNSTCCGRRSPSWRTPPPLRAVQGYPRVPRRRRGGREDGSDGVDVQGGSPRGNALRWAKTRALLAIAFIGDPDVVLLDEPRRGWIRRVEGARGPRFVDSRANRRLRLAHHPLHGRGGSTLGSRRHHVPRTIGVRRITTLPQDRVRRRIHARRRRDCSTDRRRARASSRAASSAEARPRPRGHRRGDTPRRSRRSRRFVSFPRRRDAHVRAPRVVARVVPGDARRVGKSPRKTLGVRACGVRCATLEETFLNVAERLARCDGGGEDRSTGGVVDFNALQHFNARPRATAEATSSATSSATSDDVRVHVGDFATIDPRVDHSDVDDVTPTSTTPTSTTPTWTTPTSTTLRAPRGFVSSRVVSTRVFGNARDARRAATLGVRGVDDGFRRFCPRRRARARVTARASVDPIPAMMDASYLGNLPVAFASAVGGAPADSGDVLSRHFAIPLLDLPDHADATWECDDDSPVADVRVLAGGVRRVHAGGGDASANDGRVPPQRVAAESDVSRRRAGEDDVRGDSTRRPRKTRRGLPERRGNRKGIRVRTRRLAHRVPRVTGCHVRGARRHLRRAARRGGRQERRLLALARRERRLLALARRERRLLALALSSDDHQPPFTFDGGGTRGPRGDDSSSGGAVRGARARVSHRRAFGVFGA